MYLQAFLCGAASVLIAQTVVLKIAAAWLKRRHNVSTARPGGVPKKMDNISADAYL